MPVALLNEAEESRIEKCGRTVMERPHRKGFGVGQTGKPRLRPAPAAISNAVAALERFCPTATETTVASKTAF